MSVAQFIDEAEAPERSLIVLNRTEPRQIQSMLNETFEGQSVDVDERDSADHQQDVVALVGDGEVLATSPLSALQDAIILVNSDLYVTGTQSIEGFELPAVLQRLDEVPFSLRGYPKSNKEKLLLIVISRYIERLAWGSDGGRLRSSFQRLSRINDERGTRSVYEQLADSPVDVHVYGVPDWTPPPGFQVTLHGGYDRDFRDSWFVVYTPADDADRHAALVAVETDPREWRGFWTFRQSLVPT